MATPSPGRAPLRRLNRAEYANAIRDLLSVEIDGPALLPADNAGYGFDNIADLLSVSPSLMSRYLSAAQKIALLTFAADQRRSPWITSICRPRRVLDEDRCARAILAKLARHAYRGPIPDQDVDDLLVFLPSRPQRWRLRRRHADSAHAVSDEHAATGAALTASAVTESVMFITRKCLSRRTALRGLGATIALPLLDGMVPALTPLVKTAANPVTRLGIVYIGMGAAAGYWTPATEGAGFTLTPILEPLASVRDHVLVLSGLCNQPAEARNGEPVSGHGRISQAFLSGVHAKVTEGIDVRAGVSLDRLVARQLGQSNPLPSLELCLDAPASAGRL